MKTKDQSTVMSKILDSTPLNGYYLQSCITMFKEVLNGLCLDKSIIIVVRFMQIIRSVLRYGHQRTQNGSAKWMKDQQVCVLHDGRQMADIS